MTMKQVTLILIASHGGELDRITINAPTCEDGDIFLAQIVGAYTPDWMMSPGDRIVFEFEQPESDAQASSAEAPASDADKIDAAGALLAVLEALDARGHTQATWSLAKRAMAQARRAGIQTKEVA